jgi:hypothetical protein
MRQMTGNRTVRQFRRCHGGVRLALQAIHSADEGSASRITVTRALRETAKIPEIDLPDYVIVGDVKRSSGKVTPPAERSRPTHGETDGKQ